MLQCIYYRMAVDEYTDYGISYDAGILGIVLSICIYVYMAIPVLSGND